MRYTDTQAEREDLYELLIRHVRDFAIFLLDLDGCITTWNEGAARLFGYDRSEIIGEPLARLYTPEDVAQHAPERELQEARRHGRASDDRWLMRKDGQRIWVTGVTVAIKDAEVRAFGKIIRDMTAHKEKDERIHKLNEELSERLRELEQFEEAVVGRELEMMKLKQDNQRLQEQIQKLKAS